MAAGAAPSSAGAQRVLERHVAKARKEAAAASALEASAMAAILLGDGTVAASGRGGGHVAPGVSRPPHGSSRGSEVTPVVHERPRSATPANPYLAPNPYLATRRPASAHATPASSARKGCHE